MQISRNYRLLPLLFIALPTLAEHGYEMSVPICTEGFEKMLPPGTLSQGNFFTGVKTDEGGDASAKAARPPSGISHYTFPQNLTWDLSKTDKVYNLVWMHCETQTRNLQTNLVERKATLRHLFYPTLAEGNVLASLEGEVTDPQKALVKASYNFRFNLTRPDLAHGSKVVLELRLLNEAGTEWTVIDSQEFAAPTVESQPGHHTNAGLPQEKTLRVEKNIGRAGFVKLRVIYVPTAAMAEWTRQVVEGKAKRWRDRNKTAQVAIDPRTVEQAVDTHELRLFGARCYPDFANKGDCL